MKKKKVKFRGEFNQLVSNLNDLGFRVVSETEGDNMCTIVTEGGGIFNWWKSTSTVQFQGNNYEYNRIKFTSQYGA